ncbi:MAG TPA: aminoglycoside phosphotransferase family protein [Anaerolineaceae bacterium]|nr:aminoglycoside phosphotransferase family protein [Anaerolineaceae bacterium]
MELGNVIARGRTAELFDLSENRVLKLFYDWVSPQAVMQEYEISLNISKAGVPVPRVFDLVEHEKRSGIIYEKISGETMLQMLGSKPWQVVNHSRMLAELHSKMHQIPLEGFPSFRDRWLNNIERVPNFSESIKKKLIDQVNQLPDTNQLCHFDFHPDQVIYTTNGAVILDWMTACAGHPAADVARTQILLTIGKPPDASVWMKFLASLLGKIANHYYLKRYLELNPEMEPSLIKDWLAPIAAVRLLETIQGEEQDLMKIILTKK